VKSRDIILTAKFTAVTFRQEDKPVAPEGAPAQPAPASAVRPAPTPPIPKAPASPAATPPPLPSATTPAGAKARVEKAGEKGDARNRNASGVDEAKSPAAGSDRLKGGL
jgi:hypothetical protein